MGEAAPMGVVLLLLFVVVVLLPWGVGQITELRMGPEPEAGERNTVTIFDEDVTMM